MIYKNEYIANTYRIKDHEDRRGYLRLDMNENPEGLPKKFVQEILEKITPEFLAAYPQKDNLIHIIAELEGVQTQNVTLINGSDEGIRLVFETFTHLGGHILTVTPTFEMYQVYADMFGVYVDHVPFKDDFSIDARKIYEMLDENTNLVVLLNPNSPIGTVFDDDTFEMIAQQSEKMGAMLLIDEAYYPFGAASKVSLCEKYSNVLALRTFSKLYSIAALRIGFMIGSADRIHLIENAQSTYNVNSVGILFAEELLKRKDIIQELRQSIQEGREYLSQQLEQSGYSYFAQSGNYILIKIKNNPQKIAERLKEKRILIKTYKGELLGMWIRVTLGSRHIMETFWNAFCEVQQEME